MLTRAELAERLGISERAVQRIEERALARLRSSTELQEAHDKFKQSGKPLLDLFLEHVGMAVRERDETRVLGMQQELFALWERHDALRRLGLELDDWLLVVELNEGWPEWSAVRDDAQSTMLAAAREMKVLIMKAQKALMRELGKIPFGEP
jgi:transcriptional regulator with XRE-family HTH domain